MSDLILLLPSQFGAPAAAEIRALAKQARTTVAAFQVPEVSSAGGLNKDQFIDCHHMQGVDLAKIDAEFRLREIILLKAPHSNLRVNFSLVHLWNFPDSTYNIDGVRIAHVGKTDPRNNPLGKNPGNIWAFSETLSDGKAGKQLTLFGDSEPTTVGDGYVELDAIERLVKCHTLEGDTIHVWAAEVDAKRVEDRVHGLRRRFRRIPPGESDPRRRIPVPLEEMPVSPTQLALDGPLERRGGLNRPPSVGYYICDCRHGLMHADIGCVDDVVTSPPYNIAYSPFNVPKPDPTTGSLVAPVRKGYEDELPAGMYHHLLQSTFDALDKRLNPSSADIFVNIKNNYSGGDCDPPFWMMQLIPSDWVLSDLLIWRYDISYDPGRGKYKPYYEWVFRFTKGRINRKQGSHYMQDFYIPILKGNSSERSGLSHPVVFPKKLVRTCLEQSGHTGLVVDPFLGSGTTIAAAWELNRPAVGFEYNPDYAPDIETRLKSAKKPR